MQSPAPHSAAPDSEGPPDGLVRIGARGSRLSLAQTGTVQRAIAAALGATAARAEAVAPILVITTTGDRVQDRRLLEIGGKALFTKEIELALVEGRIDAAVHSLKDVPSEDTPGLALAAFPKREDARDALLTREGLSLEALPHGAVVGTASLRRGAQLLHRRPDLKIELLRGNVDTRLRKLEEGEMDAIMLAMSGLRRLGLADRPLQALDPRDFPPAPGQGALAVQTRSPETTSSWILALDDAATRLQLAAERGALEALEGSCRTAMGAYAYREDDRLAVVVEALVPDGSERYRREDVLDLTDDPQVDLAAARALGLSLGRVVREEGGDRLVLG